MRLSFGTIWLLRETTKRREPANAAEGASSLLMIVGPKGSVADVGRLAKRKDPMVPIRTTPKILAPAPRSPGVPTAESAIPPSRKTRDPTTQNPGPQPGTLSTIPGSKNEVGWNCSPIMASFLAAREESHAPFKPDPSVTETFKTAHFFNRNSDCCHAHRPDNPAQIRRPNRNQDERFGGGGQTASKCEGDCSPSGEDRHGHR